MVQFQLDAPQAGQAVRPLIIQLLHACKQQVEYQP